MKQLVEGNNKWNRILLPSKKRNTTKNKYQQTSSTICSTFPIVWSRRLYEVIYWPGMWTNEKTFIKLCTVCQSLEADSQKPAGKMQEPNVKGLIQMLSIDLMGPLPRSPESTCWQWWITLPVGLSFLHCELLQPKQQLDSEEGDLYKMGLT